MTTKRKVLFSVIQGSDGVLEMEWHPSLRPVLDDSGKDTDKVLDLAEEFLERLNDDETEDAALA